MPITPLHIGLAIPLKAAARRWFSLSAFAIIQVAMDVEPIIRTLRGDLRLHGFTHTYFGALLIGLVMFPISLFLCPHILKIWNWIMNRYHIRILIENEPIRTVPVAIGAMIGSFSHVAIDSIMHADMKPLAPFSDRNILAKVVSIDALDLSCVFLGVIGIILWILIKSSRGRGNYNCT